MYKTISKLWVQRQAKRDGKTPNCKYPPEPAISLVTQAWDLFEALWSKQNEILHSSTSALLNKIDRNCTNRFLEFKRNQNDWFCSTYCFMLDVPQRDFLSWLRERRRSLLHMWEHLKMFIQVKMMLNCDTFFEVRVPTDRDDSDDSYSLSDNVRLNWLLSSSYHFHSHLKCQKCHSHIYISNLCNSKYVKCTCRPAGTSTDLSKERQHRYIPTYFHNVRIYSRKTKMQN